MPNDRKCRDINASMASANIGAFVAAAFISSEPNAAVASVTTHHLNMGGGICMRSGLAPKVRPREDCKRYGGGYLGNHR
jgi:hypothetical protein